MHHGERPQPAITQQFKALQGGQSRKLVTLRDSAGCPQSVRAAPANVVIDHYARVSQQPVVDATAKAEVMAAVWALQPSGGEEANGSTTMEVEEVTAASASSRPGTAPGQDGLPLIVYKKFRSQLWPILVRLYGAIGNTGRVPAHFWMGWLWLS